MDFSLLSAITKVVIKYEVNIASLWWIINKSMKFKIAILKLFCGLIIAMTNRTNDYDYRAPFLK